MAFRDDVEAANARAEAAEGRVRELEKKNQQLEARLDLAWKAVRSQRSDRRWPVLAWGLIALLGLVLVGPRALLAIPVGVLVVLAVVVPLWLRTSARPNEVLVLVGGKHRAADGTERRYRLVPPGGTVTRVPFVEHAERLDLTEVPVQLDVADAFARGGQTLRLGASAKVAIVLTEPEIHRAVERFLGRAPAEIAVVVAGILEGVVRSTIAGFDPTETENAADTLARQVADECEEDLAKLGLVLRIVTIDRIERVERLKH